ncbi:MAG TPA: ABC-2 transporter permease [Syntrophomonadaceae bacterium]|nr:ABC-2 transporter permease [Syntrophomonadaceae bacterium]
MFNLIRKDLLAQKHYLWFALGYSVFVFLAFSKPIFLPFVYIMGSVAIAYVMVLSAIQTEYINKSDIVLLSLPVQRREVVISKYLAIFLFTFAALAFMATVGLAIKLSPLPFTVRLIQWQDIVITIISVMLMAAIYFPLYYKVEGKWVQALNIIVFMLLFFAPANIINYLSQNQHSNWVTVLLQISSQRPWLIPLLGVVIGLVILAVSLVISLRIYERKDF